MNATMRLYRLVRNVKYLGLNELLKAGEMKGKYLEVRAPVVESPRKARTNI